MNLNKQNNDVNLNSWSYTDNFRLLKEMFHIDVLLWNHLATLCCLRVQHTIQWFNAVALQKMMVSFKTITICKYNDWTLCYSEIDSIWRQTLYVYAQSPYFYTPNQLTSCFRQSSYDFCNNISYHIEIDSFLR